MIKILVNKLPKFMFFRTFLVFQTLSRISLSIYALFAKQISFLQLPLILTLGYSNDLIASLYLIPVILILSIFSRLLLRKQHLRYYTALVAYKIYILILLFIVIAEIVFWDEYGTKFNFIAVDYLIYTQEIIGTLKDSLPVIPILLGIGFVSIIITYLSSKKIKTVLLEPKTTKEGLLIVICLLLSWGCSKFYNSTYTFFSNNRFANELTLNGPYEFIKAFINNSLDYNQFYTTIPSSDAKKIVRQHILQSNQSFIDDNITRKTTEAQFDKNYNVILLTVESLSAEYINYYGGSENITPNIDKLIPESLVFNNIYAVGTRTVRGLEALTLSIPPTPGSSIVRRPNNNGLFNIGTIFNQKGYDVKFVFGGYSYFDNLSKFFTHNGFQILDRSDLRVEEISFSNVWGVADEDILNKAIEAADNSYKAKKPFFQLIMTTSNHRPYTFPDGRIDLPSGGGRLAGVKYTDYAVGKFIEQAKTKEWFDNTIFVITADHCASSAGKTELPVHKYHIPLLIYAPKLIKPGVNNTLASQIDLAPTIFGLVDFDYNSKFFGKDILKSPPNRAFISTYQLLGYLKDSNLVILAPNKAPEQFKVEGKKLVKVSNNPEQVNEAIGYYQSASELYKEGIFKNE
ncbi:MAG: Phosphoglycerol transferase [Rickettsiaceae bacterium]|jgi:phosphoglycerol transferase MdoB-like AlkP superfamily enzyme|nr:Phosphoglycerol transferase [Rickettsiaceae bacterium]